jgi:hypothetical protein
MTGVVDSWFHAIDATVVCPAAAADWAFSVTLGAELVETVSPADACTWPMTVSEFVVARDMTIASVAAVLSIVTVCCEIIAKPGAAACTEYVPGATAVIANTPRSSLRAVWTRPGTDSVTDAPAIGVPSSAVTVPFTSTAFAAIAAAGNIKPVSTSHAPSERARAMSDLIEENPSVTG